MEQKKLPLTLCVLVAHWCESKNTSLNFEGMLNFIDFAGSERLSAKRAYIYHTKETSRINNSPSLLKDVLIALVNNEKLTAL